MAPTPTKSADQPKSDPNAKSAPELKPAATEPSAAAPNFANMSAAELMEFARKRMEDERKSAEARIAPIRAEADELKRALADIDAKRNALISKLADCDTRIRAIMPNAPKSAVERKPRNVGGRDPRLPAPGTKIVMKYNGVDHTAETTESAEVLMDGVRYASVSAAARAVGAKYGVDTQFNGFRSFNLG